MVSKGRVGIIRAFCRGGGIVEKGRVRYGRVDWLGMVFVFISD